MKISYKMLLAGAMAAIMSMSMFGCDDKNKETVDNTGNGGSLNYLGDYSEEEENEYLIASVGIYDKDNEREAVLEEIETIKKSFFFPDNLSSAEIDEDSCKVTVVSKDANDPVSYIEHEFMFTYNGSNYIFTFREEELYYDTGFSGVETANAGTNPSATYRFGSYTTTLSAADGATTEENVVNLATAMCNSVKNKIKDKFIQFESEEGLPTFPEGAVIDKDYLYYNYSAKYNKPKYELYFTYNGNRYSISFIKDVTYLNVVLPIENKVVLTRSNYLCAYWIIGQWNVNLYSTNDNVTEEEITALATILFNSVNIN